MKKRILLECLRMAKQHVPNHPEWDAFKHYSFIVQRNIIVEWGVNRTAEPLIGYPHYGKLHSECDAYFKARGLLNDGPFKVVNLRLNKTKDLRMSRPCACCQNFLKRLGCTEVWFSTDSAWAKLLI